eukprot:93686_1
MSSHNKHISKYSSITKQSRYKSPLCKFKNTISAFLQTKKHTTSNWCCFKRNNTHQIHTNSNMNCIEQTHTGSTSHSESTSISESHTNKSIKLHNKLLPNSKYIITKHIAKTLQGEVCIAEYAKYKQLVYGYVHQIANNLLLETDIPVHIFDICYLYFHEQVVIKRAEKLLHFLGITITEDGTRYKVKENIIQEAQLMEMFMQYNPPNTLIQFRDFYQDTNNFYLVMEKGGMGLLQFTIKCHKLIVDGKLSLHEWRKSVRNIFVKMVTFINWMHNVVHCCNLDISLENIVISNDTYFDENASKIRNLN